MGFLYNQMSYTDTLQRSYKEIEMYSGYYHYWLTIAIGKRVFLIFKSNKGRLKDGSKSLWLSSQSCTNHTTKDSTQQQMVIFSHDFAFLFPDGPSYHINLIFNGAAPVLSTVSSYSIIMLQNQMFLSSNLCKLGATEVIYSYILSNICAMQKN